MKIMVVDREDLSTQMIASRLEPIGHNVEHEPVKNNAPERMIKGQHNVVFIDPSPLTSARPLIMNIRRAVPGYSYIALMTQNASREEAIKAGCNDYLAKPLSNAALDTTIENADRLLKLTKRIGDDSEDFPSAGGVIAKSAFNQLFLSAIDRADRYGERSFVLFISMSNYAAIVERDGHYAGDYAVAILSKYLVRLRRQSDIIGQTAKYEYALLLQRPQYETEPVEAANRFAESIAKLDDVFSAGPTPPEISISLVDLPVGGLLARHVITRESADAAKAAKK